MPPSSPNTILCKSKTLTSSRFKTLLLIFSSLCILYLLVCRHRISTPVYIHHTQSYSSPPTSVRHLAFGIASSSRSWPKRKHYVRLWWKPHHTRGFVFIDRAPSGSDTDTVNGTDGLPPVLVSEDTSRFPYTFKGGLRSAVRVSRIVSEIVNRNLSDVRWFVFGDDDTVFFPENLAKTLSKYDHRGWYYVGSNSESFEQNMKYSFDMAFGGGGFAISYPLAKVLARVLDSCLMRYANLYGSDSRVFSCLAELGVGLTHESGFHQVDLRGDVFGMLSSHPLTPLVSLHHLDYVEPIFPNMNRTQAFKHLFQAFSVDPSRILQQTVCYDRLNARTVSVAWGYSVQLFEGNQLLPNLLAAQVSFMPWRRNMNPKSSLMFNLREYPKDPCKRHPTFFLESVISAANGIQSNYKRFSFGNCTQISPSYYIEQIRVFSEKLELDFGQLQAPRRHCCDILPSSVDQIMNIGIRQCGDEELVAMKL